MSKNFHLDPPTIAALKPLHELGDKAMQERDAWNRWSVEIAAMLGVPVGNFRSNIIAEQYAELRERITADLKNEKVSHE